MTYATIFKIKPDYFSWLQNWEHLNEDTKAKVDAFIEDLKSKGIPIPDKKRKL